MEFRKSWIHLLSSQALPAGPGQLGFWVCPSPCVRRPGATPVFPSPHFSQTPHLPPQPRTRPLPASSLAPDSLSPAHNQRQHLKGRIRPCHTPALKSPWLPSPLERNDETGITQPPPTDLPSPPPLLPHSVPASRTSWLCLVDTQVIPTSGPLHVLFPLPGMLFPWLGTKPREGKFFAQSHTARKGKSSDSNHSCPALDHTQASHPLPAPIKPRGSLQEGGGGGRGHIAAETPGHAGPAGLRDRPPNAMFLPWWAGGHSDRTPGHRDGSTGCRQGGQCPAVGALSLLAEPGQGKVRWPQENSHPSPFPSLSQPKGRGLCTLLMAPPQAWGRLCLLVMDGRPAEGGCPGNRAIPKATGRPARGCGPATHLPPPARGWGQGLQGPKKDGRRR